MSDFFNKVKDGWSEGKKQGKRAAQDAQHDPSNSELFKRAVVDEVTHVRISARDSSEETKKHVNNFCKKIVGIVDNDGTFRDKASGVQEVVDQVIDTAKKTVGKDKTVLEALGNFGNKLVDMIKSLAGTEREQNRAWEKLKNATKEVGGAIKRAPQNIKKSTGFSR